MNSEEPVHVEIEKRRIIICYVILPTVWTTVGDKHEAIETGITTNSLTPCCVSCVTSHLEKQRETPIMIRRDARGYYAILRYLIHHTNATHYFGYNRLSL